MARSQLVTRLAATLQRAGCTGLGLFPAQQLLAQSQFGAALHVCATPPASSGSLLRCSRLGSSWGEQTWRMEGMHHTRSAHGDTSPGKQGGSTDGEPALDTPGIRQERVLEQPVADVHYEGPLSKTHKMLKMISISNTAIALVAAPCIIEFAEVSYVSRVGLASSLVFFGLLTTGALHWITHPYVHELKFTAATQQFNVRTTSLLGFHKWHSFDLSDVQPLPWDRPVATFMANNRYFYIDVYSFPDEKLLKWLTPDGVPEGFKDDKDEDD